MNQNLLLGHWMIRVDHPTGQLKLFSPSSSEYGEHPYYLSGRPVIASCITEIFESSDHAIHVGHERHVTSNVPKLRAWSAAGVAKPEKAQRWTQWGHL